MIKSEEKYDENMNLILCWKENQKVRLVQQIGNETTEEHVDVLNIDM